MKFNNNEELGKYFKSAIEKDSSLEIEALKAEIEALKTEARQHFKAELEEEKIDILASRARNIFKEHQEELSVKQRTLDLLVMEKRMHLIDELFKTLEQKIEHFRNTPENEKWFKKKLDNYDLKTFDTIEVNPKDIDKAPKGLKVVENPSIRAGFVLYNEKLNRLAVETISSNLKEARTYFYQNAKWFSE
jgi:vacuolar-type H+-ATPase subunit E/Vma4